MNVVHLTDSPFFGGPERQILGLAVSLPPSVRTVILCFRDHASGAPFLERLRASGVAARMLEHANPHFTRIVANIVEELRKERADLLVCHGYKADLLGWIAARRVGVPVVSVSRGWTSHTWKVRLNEALGRRMLRFMDAVVCVSNGQATKVLRCGVRADRVHVIRNAIDPTRFTPGDRDARAVLQSLFPTPPELVVMGVGRLSPEKGFDQLVAAAQLVVSENRSTGFVLVGDGPDRGRLEQQVRSAGLENQVAFAGFRSDVDQLLAGADVLAQSSYTEGLPNVILEACAAGVPVVATDVGGTREVVRDGVNGYLVPPRDAKTLAARLVDLLRAPAQRRAMGAQGREIVREQFSFAHQSLEYGELFAATRTSPGPLDVTTPVLVKR